MNKKYDFDIFSTAVRCGKEFVAEQKLRELKKRIFKLKAMENRLSKKMNPYQIILKSADNMISLPSGKYKQTRNEIEKKSLNSETSKEKFSFLRLKRIREEKVRQEKFNRKIYERKKLKLRSPLE